MADVLLFHHAQGLTDGVRAFADDLRAAGHAVTVPDLYEGETFDTLEAGVAHAGALSFGTLVERARKAATELDEGLVYAGFSLGVLPAQALAQTRPGAAGALLLHSAIPPTEFGGPWPEVVPLQVHIAEHDPIAVQDGDLATARELADASPDAELFLYDTAAHLFSDRTLADYDEPATRLLLERVLAFLAAR
jgi:dienelactone hydrolase